MPIVKCVYCGEKFDRDKIKSQKIGRRYAHLTCNEPRVDVNGDSYNAIIQYCSTIFKDTTQYARIGKQIKDYKTQGMTYEGIYLSLKYWYEIKKNDITKSNGSIGIVPYVYKEAKEYWKTIEDVYIPKIEEEIIVIKHKPHKDLLASLLEGMDEGEE